MTYYFDLDTQICDIKKLCEKLLMAPVSIISIIQFDVTQILSHSSVAAYAWLPGILPCLSSLVTSKETGEMLEG